MSNVARAWTIAWGVIAGVEPPDGLPASYVEMVKEIGLSDKRLSDPPFKLGGAVAEAATRSAREVVDFIKKKIFPIHGLR